MTTLKFGNGQEIVFKTAHGTYLSTIDKFQCAIVPLRKECVYVVEHDEKNPNQVRLRNKVAQIYLNGKQSMNWIIKQGEGDTIILLDPTPCPYGVRGQGEFYFSQDSFISQDDGISILTKFDLDDDETSFFDPVAGDKVIFENVWGKYFGYQSTKPTLFSAPCPECIFTVFDEPKSGGLKFISDYSTVTMCGEQSNHDSFKIIESQTQKGYKHLFCIPSKKYIGALPVGKVMLWDDTTLFASCWRIIKQ